MLFRNIKTGRIISGKKYYEIQEIEYENIAENLNDDNDEVRTKCEELIQFNSFEGNYEPIEDVITELLKHWTKEDLCKAASQFSNWNITFNQILKWRKSKQDSFADALVDGIIDMDDLD